LYYERLDGTRTREKRRRLRSLAAPVTALAWKQLYDHIASEDALFRDSWDYRVEPHGERTASPASAKVNLNRSVEIW
jgi:hypothetical protein